MSKSNIKQRNKRASMKKTTATTPSSDFVLAGIGGQPSRVRIRVPHPHDVLSGRGGGINSHDGNIRFREWVHERKDEYNLSQNKIEKTRIAQEVMALVRKQNPPGRFLMKDPTTAQDWWVEVDDNKAMSKTSQALREGAPSIRAQHKEAMQKQRGGKSSRGKTTPKKSRRHKESEPATSTGSMGPPMPMAPIHMSPEASRLALKTAFEAAAAGKDDNATTPPVHSNVKVTPEESALPETPPLLPVSPRGEPPSSFPLPLTKPSQTTNNNMKRAHSLALSDISAYDFEEDFVNPFEEESVVDSRKERKEKEVLGSRWRRETSSNSSHGDMGGIGALLNYKPGRRSSSSFSFNNNNNNSGRNLFRNVSSRSSMSEWSNMSLPDEGYSVSESDFDEGLKSLYVDKGDVIPTHLEPFRGGSALTRRLSPQVKKRGSMNDVTTQ